MARRWHKKRQNRKRKTENKKIKTINTMKHLLFAALMLICILA